MAFRLKIGKFKLKGFSFPQLGVRGSLFAAFTVIAAMAIVISAGAGLMLRHLGGTMVELSGRDIPRLAASLQLSALSASLASQGPALLAAHNEETLSERAKKMKETQTLALQKLDEITRMGADKYVVAALTETVKNIDDMTKSLGSAAREKLGAAAQHDKQYKILRQAHADFVKASAPGDEGCAEPDQGRAGIALSFGRRGDRGGADGRAAQQRDRQHQSGRRRHDGRAVSQ